MIPQIGLGVLFVPDDEAEKVVTTALELGYRHIDTAQLYHNEAGVGAALAHSGLRRDELYVTTKPHNGHHEHARTKASLAESLDRLGLDRLDLFLIHWPVPTLKDRDYVSTWEEPPGDEGDASVQLSPLLPPYRVVHRARRRSSLAGRARNGSARAGHHPAVAAWRTASTAPRPATPNPRAAYASPTRCTEPETRSDQPSRPRESGSWPPE